MKSDFVKCETLPYRDIVLEKYSRTKIPYLVVGYDGEGEESKWVVVDGIGVEDAIKNSGIIGAVYVVPLRLCFFADEKEKRNEI